MRRKKIHSGASRAKASGSQATPSVRPSSRGSPYAAASTGASTASTSAAIAASASSSVKAYWYSRSTSCVSRATKASSIPTRLSASTVITVVDTIP